jgi:uncharacterized protein YggE
MLHIKALAFCMAAICLTQPALAQNAATGSIDIVNMDVKADAPTLTLTIIGTAKARPDIAIISSGVSTKSPNASRDDQTHCCNQSKGRSG